MQYKYTIAKLLPQQFSLIFRFLVSSAETAAEHALASCPQDCCSAETGRLPLVNSRGSQLYIAPQKSGAAGEQQLVCPHSPPVLPLEGHVINKVELESLAQGAGVNDGCDCTVHGVETSVMSMS